MKAMSELLAAAGCVALGVVALLFYRLRCRWQFVYGLGELVVGMAMIFLALYPQTPNYLSDTWGPPLGGWLLSNGVAIIVGIYVMVSGLDNAARG